MKILILAIAFAIFLHFDNSQPPPPPIIQSWQGFQDFMNHRFPSGLKAPAGLPSYKTENCDIIPADETISGKSFETQVMHQNPWNIVMRRCQDVI